MNSTHRLPQAAYRPLDGWFACCESKTDDDRVRTYARVPITAVCHHGYSGK